MPVFIFGEAKSFYHTDIFLNQRIKINKFKIPGALFLNPLLIYPNP